MNINSGTIQFPKDQNGNQRYLASSKYRPEESVLFWSRGAAEWYLYQLEEIFESRARRSKREAQ